MFFGWLPGSSSKCSHRGSSDLGKGNPGSPRALAPRSTDGSSRTGYSGPRLVLGPVAGSTPHEVNAAPRSTAQTINHARDQRMSNVLSPVGPSSDIPTASTREAGGPVRHHSITWLTAAGSPSTTTSTEPSGALRTQPPTPAALDLRAHETRKPTPWTSPRTITRRRTTTASRLSCERSEPPRFGMARHVRRAKVLEPRHAVIETALTIPRKPKAPVFSD